MVKTVNEVVCEFIGLWPSKDMEVAANKSDDSTLATKLMTEYNDAAYLSIEKILMGEVREAAGVLKAWDDLHPDSLVQGNSVRYILEKLLGADKDGTSIVAFMESYPEFLDKKIEIVERTVRQDIYRSLLDVDEKTVMTAGQAIMAPIVNIAVMFYRNNKVESMVQVGVGDESAKKFVTIADSFLAPHLSKEAHSFLLKTFYDLGDIESFSRLIDRGISPDVPSYIRPYRALIHEMVMDAVGVENHMDFFKKIDGLVKTDVIDGTGRDFPFPISLAVREKAADIVEWCLNQPDVPWEWLTPSNIKHAFDFDGFDGFNGFTAASERESASRPSEEVQRVIDDWSSRTGMVIEEKSAVNIGSPVDIDFDF